MTTTVEFLAAPVGLEPLRDFQLSPVDGADHLYALRSLADPDVRLYLLDGMLFPSYAPELTDEQAAELALRSSDDAALYLVVNPSTAQMTVNLLAPIVVNARSGRAAQVILEDKTWSIAAPLSGLI
ncbi:MAG: flagellar assembly protein FliW [Microbacteriaceae bacterium]|nr:MAG: flagellar assembly protein FliW [Microbacteriaceae bacterium]